MANRFYGSYRQVYTKTRVFITNTGKRMETGPRGVRAEVQAIKRDEAVSRDARTPHTRTKQHRVRCSVFGKFACEAA